MCAKTEKTSANFVPTGRVIKYPTKCALFPVFRGSGTPGPGTPILAVFGQDRGLPTKPPISLCIARTSAQPDFHEGIESKIRGFRRFRENPHFWVELGGFRKIAKMGSARGLREPCPGDPGSGVPGEPRVPGPRARARAGPRTGEPGPGSWVGVRREGGCRYMSVGLRPTDYPEGSLSLTTLMLVSTQPSWMTCHR